MGNKKGFRAIALFLAALMLLSFLGPVVLRVFAGDSSIDELQSKLDELTKQQKALQTKINSSTASRKTELQKKNDLERQINNLGDKIALYDQLIAEYDQQIAQKEQESEEIQQQVDRQMELYLTRIRETYEIGNVSFFDVLFGSASLNEFMTHLDHAAEIARYDENLISTMRANKQTVLDSKAEIELARASQAALLEEASKDQASLQASQSEVDSLIQEIDSDLEKNKRLLEEAEAEEERFSQELKALLAQRTDSSYIGGDMIWPTPGYTYITCVFGMRTHPITGVYKMHTGVDIGAAGGTQILAANTGEVVSAGYNSVWGNYIAIDHGGGLSTFYAHMKTSALFSVGQTVTRGEKIGIVGSTGYSTGNHLHFEVRVNGESVQPLDYVTPS